MASEIVGVALRGQTIGKAAMGLRVVRSADATVPGFDTAFVRLSLQSFNIGRSFHPFLGSTLFVVVGPWPLICYGPILFDREMRRGLHDRIAGTVVIDVRDGVRGAAAP